MNTLTKVFVVLLVIFSVAFTMMTVQFSATIPNWRQQAEEWKTLAQQIDTYNRNLVAAKVAEAAKAAEDRQAWEEQKQQLSDQLAELQRDLRTKDDRIAKLESDLASRDGIVNKLTAELSIAQTSAAKTREHRNTLEERNLYLENANVDLTEALNEKIATIIVLEQQTRQQEQAVNLLRVERDKLAKKLRLPTTGVEVSTVTAPTEKVRAATVPKITPIRGQISQVAGQYASISVGSNDGVEVGMTFIIYNRGGYLGDLEVTDVQPNEAAGKLKFMNGTITVGDLVADENGYLAMN